jgi:multiple sugar transport system substrate-binding protein
MKTRLTLSGLSSVFRHGRLSLALLAVLCASLVLAACGDNTPTTAPATTAAATTAAAAATTAAQATTAAVTSAAATTAATAKTAAVATTVAATTSAAPALGDPNLKGSVTFWHTYSADSKEQETLKNIVLPGFAKLYPNVKVDAQQIPDTDFRQKLLTGIGGDILPDVARLDIQYVPEFADMGALAKLDDMPGFADIKADAYPGPLSTNFWKGSYYGLPLDTNTKVLMYNKSDLQAAGLSAPPKTMDEFFAAAKKLTVSGKQFGFVPSGTGAWSILPFFWSLGGNVTDDGITKASGYLNSADSVAALQQLVDLKKAGVMPDAIFGGGISTMEGLATGQYAIIDDGPWMNGIAASQFPDFQINYAPMPAGKGGSIGIVGGEDLVMFAKSKDNPAAWAFSRYMLSKDVQLAMGKIGQLPAIKSVATAPELASLPYYSAFLAQLQSTKARLPHPAWTKIETVLNDTFEAAFRGDKDVKTLLDAAAPKVDTLLAGTK